MLDRINALSRVPLFAPLDKRFVKGLAGVCTERGFKAGEVLMKQGEAGIGLSIIVSGKVKVEKFDPAGAVVEISSNGPGDVMGELAVIDGYPRTATVTAEEDTQCLCLANWEFKAFMNSHPEVALGIIPIVLKRFRETNASLAAARENGP